MGIRTYTTWTKEKDLFLIKNYPYGNSKDICKHLGCTRQALKKRVQMLGVKSLKSKNLNKLEKLTVENKTNYYWWGFILADGYISNRGQLGITLSEEDVEHLEKLTNSLNVRIKKRTVITDYGIAKTAYMTCQDAKFGFVLKDKLGISENKTYKGIDFSWINNRDKFMSVFIGFVDGDGCMSKAKNGKVNSIKIEIHRSWYDFLKFCSYNLKQYFKNSSISVTINSRGYALMRIYKIKTIRSIKKYAESNDLPILQRKWTLI